MATKDDFFNSLKAHKGDQVSNKLLEQLNKFVNALGDNCLDYIKNVIVRYQQSDGGFITMRIILENDNIYSISIFPNGHTIMSDETYDANTRQK